MPLLFALFGLFLAMDGHPVLAFFCFLVAADLCV